MHGVQNDRRLSQGGKYKRGETFEFAAIIPIQQIASFSCQLFKPSPKWGPSDKSVAYDISIGYVPGSPRTIDFESRGVYSMRVDDDIPDAYTSI